MWFKFLTCLVVSVHSAKITQDSIAFPESEENLNLINKQDRRPVFLPSTCGDNELYYPGDQKDDWICDCRPGFLYYPQRDSCWPAFQKGPCDMNKYLVLPSNSVIPICVKNPCSEGYVMWNGRCERLGSSSPCHKEFPPTILWVNATTINVECVTLDFDKRFQSVIAENGKCWPGCKRHVKNKCVPNL